MSEIGATTLTAQGPKLHLAAFRWAFIACAIVAAAVIPIAIRIRDDLAAATMVKKTPKPPVVTEALTTAGA